MSIALPWSWRWWPGARRRDGKGGAPPAGEEPGSEGGAEPGEAATEAGRLTGADDEDDAATRFGGGGRRGRYVTVYVAGNLAEAHVVKGRLDTEGIPALLKYDPLDSVLYPALSVRGVEVQVAAGLVDRALAVLDEE